MAVGFISKYVKDAGYDFSALIPLNLGQEKKQEKD